MKKYILFSLIIFGLTACQSAESQTDPSKVTRDIDQTEMALLAERPGAIIVDVRTPEEVAQGAIEGAVFINFYDEDFMQQAEAKLPKNQPIIIYCKSGGRSGQAMSKLSEAGWQEVYNLEGGYSNYSKK